MAYGFRFQPGLVNGNNGNGDGSRRPSGSGPQSPVEIRSLRIPDQPSPTSVAPLPLLQSAGGAVPGAQGLDSMVAALVNAFKPQTAAPASLQAPSGLGRGPMPQAPSFTPSQPSRPQESLAAREERERGDAHRRRAQHLDWLRNLGPARGGSEYAREFGGLPALKPRVVFQNNLEDAPLF